MINTAKCPKCEAIIANIHYEAHKPNFSSGFRGSPSFTAVAYPCKHALGAVPITWEMRLEEIDKVLRELNKKVGEINTSLSALQKK